MNHSASFCGTNWDELQRFVTHNSVLLGTRIIFHTIGTILNALIVIIFTRKRALTSSNLLFTSLAISDLIVFIIGFPPLCMDISHYFGSTLDQERIVNDYFYTFQNIFYHTSLYHTMILAVWRYIAITHPLKERILCNLKITFISIILNHVICFLSFLPELLGLTIFLVPETSGTTTHAPDKKTSEAIHSYLMSTRNLLNPYNDLIYIVILKAIPCTIVAICTLRFIRVLQNSKTRRRTMIANFNEELLQKEKETNRTTKMVLGITIFCLTINVLMGIDRILIIIYGDGFKKDCFPGITAILNFLALIYLTIPFVVYYVINRQFRDNFKTLIASVKCVRISFSISQ